MSSGRRPTMADVAARAGVSLSTVSLSYSGAGPISPDMKARVERAAAELGYSGPSPQARALRSGKTRVVGLVLHERLQFAMRDPFTLGVLDALIGDLGDSGLGVLLISTPAEDSGEPSLIDTASMDAAVVMRLRSAAEPAIQMLNRRGLPIVTVEGTVEGASSVVIDDAAATTELVRHLLGLGHERIGVVTLSRSMGNETRIATDNMLEDHLWTPTRNRLQGFYDAGISPTVVVETKVSMVSEGIAAGHLVLDHPSKPTAIVCQSDMRAGGVVLAAREKGLDVPRDVSVTGFDGIDLAWLEPTSLTTVTQDAAAKGHVIARAVKDLLEGKEPRMVNVPLELRIGNTTAAPRS